MTTARVDDADLNRVFQRGPFTVEPFTGASRLIWEQRQHVVCGISPGNSYFQLARLTDLLGWLCEEFAQVDVVIPDSALEHTYHALGYDPQRAAKKTRGEINVLCNRVARAWKSNGGPRAVDGLHRMSDLASGAVYREKLAECEQALNEDSVLWQTCAEMSREVLAARGHDGPLTADQIERAMRYLTAELPFFLASSDIFGVPSSLNFYHRQLPLAELIFSGKSLIQASPRQAYATIRPTQ
ncbi:tRNA-dependent cyclodipeptide synthase [Streptomyces sp. H10-C2]|uniref:tRNA-dependent cyclodipeptide synthase n=1 Tax=unclassified Streptomyces TaxID=2593676 RepID=UPI0024BA0E34|nr:MULTISPECIES: tRNA-dependent cyclodipeptide synthase [unclassified Streptomyces]MDJ0344418.1 tRNA-dependent cyclodipeptide synthase [Streptomyces sp. PH10-H1]MDJ0372106.1 tRNA-dependent cyclodipeptide synthase [Streptomyces sp. H10-C2]